MIGSAAQPVNVTRRIRRGGPAQNVNSRGGQVPQVFLDYDQDELDRAYDQRVWALTAPC